MIADSELTRTFEKNHIKIRTNCHRVMENGWIWEGIPLMNACLVSVRILSSFKRNPMMACLKKIFNGEIICHLKKRLKRLCYYKLKAWYIIVKSRIKKNLHISIIHQSTFWEGHHHLILSLGTKYCVAIKEQIESLYFPEGK